MAGARIDIEITGKDAGATAAFNKANTAAAQLGATAQKTSAVLGGATVAGSNRAAFALQNLGRVAQDAPFGFIGIQNNLNPLLESFQQLREQTGSTGEALKALGASLVGSGGLLLAVSLITAAFTVLAQNPEKVESALNSLSGVVESATGAQRDYNEAISEGEGNARVEISNINSLISIIRDENLARNTRIEALKQVKKEYPEQLKFLTLENSRSREAAEGIDILTRSILRKAKIQAAEKIIGDAYTRQIEAETKSITEQASTLDKLVGAFLNISGFKNNLVFTQGLKNQQEVLKTTGQEINTYEKILKNLLTADALSGTLFDDGDGKKTKGLKKTFVDVFKELNQELAKTDAAVDITFGEGSKAKVSSLARAIDQLVELGFTKNDGLIQGLQDRILGADAEKFANTSKKFLNGVQDVVVRYTESASLLNKTPLIPIEKLTEDTAKALTVFDKFAADVNNIISIGLVEGLSGVGEAIGNALATGENVLQAFGQSVLSSIGDVLIQFGKLTLAAGVASLALKMALKNPFGPGGLAAIAAGTALIAIGGLVRGFSSRIGEGGDSGGSGGGRAKVPGFANGVNDFMGGLAWVGERGPELVNLPTGSNVIPNHNLGQYIGKDSASVTVSGVLRGRDIYLLNKKEQALAYRNGER